RSGLCRAGLVLLTRCDLVAPERVAELVREIETWAPGVPIAHSEHRPAQWRSSRGTTLALEALAGRPIAAFCGLGHPEAFRRSLVRLGLDVVAWRTFPDHHAYHREDIDDLRRWAREQPANTALATTQKDLVKIRLERLGDRELWALQIRLHVASGQ